MSKRIVYLKQNKHSAETWWSLALCQWAIVVVGQYLSHILSVSLSLLHCCLKAVQRFMLPAFMSPPNLRHLKLVGVIKAKRYHTHKPSVPPICFSSPAQRCHVLGANGSRTAITLRWVFLLSDISIFGKSKNITLDLGISLLAFFKSFWHFFSFRTGARVQTRHLLPWVWQLPLFF